MTSNLSRRQLLATAGAAAAAGLLAADAPGAPGTPAPAPGAPAAAGAARTFSACLNTATIRGQKLGLVEEIELCAKAGYHGIEPWLSEIARYRDAGGSLPDLAKRLADLGLAVAGVVAFPNWLTEDEAKRKAGLEQAKRDFELVAAIGGKRMAAPPVGESTETAGNPLKVAERYRAFLDLGQAAGVAPQLELWGHSRTLGRLGQAMQIAIESGHPAAGIIPDVFHLYKAGVDFGGLALVPPAALHVFHVNDYPADPPRERANDGHRVFPGDGVAPVTMILQTLRRAGVRCMLSIETFNRDYWKLDALTALRTGREKLQAVIDKAIGA